MKKEIIISIFILVILPLFSYSQCLPDRHSATWYDGWISCEATENPNPVRGKNHWIKYDLDDIYYLYELHVWNMNAPDLLGYDLKDVVIDLSSDGVTWTEFGQYTFSQATGKNDYEGVDEINFEGAKAKHILITALTNYGDTCYALSEIKIRARNLCNGNIITWKGGDGDWDVATNWCGDQVPTMTDSVWIPPNKTVHIPNTYSAEALWLDIDINSTINIDGTLNISGN